MEPSAALDEMILQAKIAVEAGFDGISLSEHHAGFEGYLPTPILGASWILHEVDAAWVAACPVLLPLRPLNLLVEEIAWLSCRHPGRLGVGFAPGFAASDFALAGVPLETRRASFYRDLGPMVQALRGEAEGLLADDPAVNRCRAHPVPVVAAVAGPVAAKAAARAEAGVLIATFKDSSQARELSSVYRSEGGTGPRVLVRRCWIGARSSDRTSAVPPSPARSAPRTFANGERTDMVSAQDSDELVQRLYARFAESNSSALSIRFHLPGTTPMTIRDQIRRFGYEVLPKLRDLIGQAAPT